MNKVWRLQREMRKLPQLDLSDATSHYFAQGMYCRMLEQPEGSTVVGKVHKQEHFLIVAKGSIRVEGGDGVMDVSAPSVIVSQPGTKRAIYALEDCAYINVHRIEKTDLDEIEAELVEPDETALCDATNKPRSLTWHG
jgi:hypothetical protein